MLKLICAIPILLSVSAFADEFQLKLVPPKESSITHLEWEKSPDTQEPEIQVRKNGEAGAPFFVKLRGKYDARDQSLLYQDSNIPRNESGNFEIEVGISEEETELPLREIDKVGNVRQETWKLLFPEFESFKLTLAPPPKWSFQAGLGVSGLSFSQTDSASLSTKFFTQLGVDVRGQGRYQLSSILSLEGLGSFTALPFSIGPTQSTIRFLILDAQLALLLSRAHSRWKVELLGAYSYLTTFPSQSTFGISHVQGVTLYPKVQRLLSGGKKVWALAKFMPIIGGGFSLLNLSNYVFNAQIGYQGFRVNQHFVEITLGVNLLSIVYTGATTGAIQSNSYSVGVNYLF